MPRLKVSKTEDGEIPTSSTGTGRTMKRKMIPSVGGSKIPLKIQSTIKKVKTEPDVVPLASLEGHKPDLLNTTYTLNTTYIVEESNKSKNGLELEILHETDDQQRKKKRVTFSGQNKPEAKIKMVKTASAKKNSEEISSTGKVKNVKSEKGLRERTSAINVPDHDEIAFVRITRSSVKKRIKAETGDSEETNLPSVPVPDKSEKKVGKLRGKQRTGVQKVESVSSDTKLAAKKKRKIKAESDTVTDAGKDIVSSPGVSGCSRKFIGAHVSIVGGLENAVFNAKAIGASAFGLFLKSQRSWACKALEDDAAERFIAAYKEHGISPDMILPHGSYLLNCGSPNNETLLKSRKGLIDELQRCDRLGLPLFNFHPGSTCGEISVEECVRRIAESINMAHAKSKYVTTVIENMSCQGHTLGGRFEELRAIIDQVKDQNRIGVCLDTCHAFAAGFNIATKEGYEQMVSDFENIVGLKYLKAVHLNDSMGEVGCHKDRHENIGKGKIGLAGFRRLMKDPRFDNIPMILETPAGESDLDEIKILNSMCQK